MTHIDISKTGLDPMATLNDEQFDAAQKRYLAIIQKTLPDWAEWDCDDCYLTISTDDDHEDEDLQEYIDRAWTEFCEEA